MIIYTVAMSANDDNDVSRVICCSMVNSKVSRFQGIRMMIWIAAVTQFVFGGQSGLSNECSGRLWTRQWSGFYNVLDRVRKVGQAMHQHQP